MYIYTCRRKTKHNVGKSTRSGITFSTEPTPSAFTPRRTEEENLLLFLLLRMRLGKLYHTYAHPCCGSQTIKMPSSTPKKCISFTFNTDDFFPLSTFVFPLSLSLYLVFPSLSPTESFAAPAASVGAERVISNIIVGQKDLLFGRRR